MNADFDDLMMIIILIKAPPRTLEISFPRIYFERGLTGSLHLSGKKLLQLLCLVILITRHYKYLHVKKSFYGMLFVIFNSF